MDPAVSVPPAGAGGPLVGFWQADLGPPPGRPALTGDTEADVCIVGAVDPFKLFCMFPTVYAGRHLGIKEVEYFRATRVRVETEHPLDVYADGEYVCRTPVEVGVQPAALKVVTLSS